MFKVVTFKFPSELPENWLNADGGAYWKIAFAAGADAVILRDIPCDAGVSVNNTITEGYEMGSSTMSKREFNRCDMLFTRRGSSFQSHKTTTDFITIHNTLNINNVLYAVVGMRREHINSLQGAIAKIDRLLTGDAPPPFILDIYFDNDDLETQMFIKGRISNHGYKIFGGSYPVFVKSSSGIRIGLQTTIAGDRCWGNAFTYSAPDTAAVPPVLGVVEPSRVLGTSLLSDGLTTHQKSTIGESPGSFVGRTEHSVEVRGKISLPRPVSTNQKSITVVMYEFHPRTNHDLVEGSIRQDASDHAADIVVFRNLPSDVFTGIYMNELGYTERADCVDDKWIDEIYAKNEGFVVKSLTGLVPGKVFLATNGAVTIALINLKMEKTDPKFDLASLRERHHPDVFCIYGNERDAAKDRSLDNQGYAFRGGDEREQIYTKTMSVDFLRLDDRGSLVRLMDAPVGVKLELHVLQQTYRSHRSGDRTATGKRSIGTISLGVGTRMVNLRLADLCSSDIKSLETGINADGVSSAASVNRKWLYIVPFRLDKQRFHTRSVVFGIKDRPLVKPKTMTAPASEEEYPCMIPVTVTGGATWIVAQDVSGLTSVILIDLRDHRRFTRIASAKPLPTPTTRHVNKAQYNSEAFETDTYRMAKAYVDVRSDMTPEKRDVFLAAVPRFVPEWEWFERCEFYYDAFRHRDGWYGLKLWVVERPRPRACPMAYVSIDPDDGSVRMPKLPPPPHPCDRPLNLAPVERNFFRHPSPATFTTDVTDHPSVPHKRLKRTYH